MGILSRVSSLLKANINDLIDRAEDPEKMIKQLIMDMEEGLREAKVAVAAAITEEKKLQQALGENRDQAQKWYAKAELALTKGEEELAREALRRKKIHDENLASFTAQHEEQVKVVAKLKEQLYQLETKLDEAKRKKETLIARHKRAKAQKQIAESLAGISKDNVFAAFERMEDKVENLEAQAQAAEEVQTDTLDDRFAKLGADDDIEAELAKMKEKLPK